MPTPLSMMPSALDHPSGPDGAQVAPAITALVVFFETLRPERLDDLARHYAAQARFKDPFNDVRGLAAIRSIFEHMFATLDGPRFEVTGCVQQGQQCVLTWVFHFRFRRWARGVDQRIEGASWLEFDRQGQVLLHRDYWDAAEELYEKLPVLGALMRRLRRAASSR